MTSTATRKAHAPLDVASRSAKGLKIERLLSLADRTQPLRLLDIGTGNGGIAHYFATHDALQLEVTSVDIVDIRKVSAGYTFVQISGTKLPFADGYFDIVISNHVIEHVGEREAQTDHLREVSRVMAASGLGYLAVPNRWMVNEPHYRLPFLSWLPYALRTPYLKLARKGDFYDCEPLSTNELEKLLKNANLAFKHLHIESIRETLAIEGVHGMARWIGLLPDWALMLLKSVTPTLIYKIEHVR